MTDAIITQGGSIMFGALETDAQLSQGGMQTLGIPFPPCILTQGGQITFAAIVIDMILTQGGLVAFSRYRHCATQHCQCWIIKCKDGTTYRFTGLDVDFEWVGGTYKACGSLDPSASEQGSQLGDVGNQELVGVITDDAITEEDLYGGRFDDAYVEVWEVPYRDAGGEIPHRIAAGWMGSLSHGNGRFTAEVLGPGDRLTQQSIVQTVSPKCRWVFGDEHCGKDVEALKTDGDVILCSNRESFMANITLPSAGAFQWENGKVRWTSGRNNGTVCETKAVDFDTGVIVLWALPPFLPEAGDTFDLLPGCLQDKPTCKNVYDNLINFGGFDIPGENALNETPNASSN